MSWTSKLFKSKKDDERGEAADERIKLPPGCTPDKDNRVQPGEAGYSIIHEKTGLQIVWVPGTKGLDGRAMLDGGYLMGSTPEEVGLQWKENSWTWEHRSQPEQPKHPVELSAFWMARTEVPNASFQRFAAKSGVKLEGKWAEYNLRGRSNYPAAGMTWKDAKAFCDWAGLELPTEAQWEWAARGPEGYTFPWGDNWEKSYCNNLEASAGSMPTSEDFDRYISKLNTEAMEAKKRGIPYDTSKIILELIKPIGSFPKDMSWCGALDLAGNVTEWCSDFRSADYYSHSPKKDPKGPEKGFDRIWRGGAGNKVAIFCRCANRGMTFSTDTNANRGFRPCLPAGMPAG